MARWRIKEISEMTCVSVRMLHHYDKIGLLKPSMRASNGYRYYLQQDLEKLQQIVALKFFGFSLKVIKTILSKPSNIHEHLCVQQKMLIEQAESIRHTRDALAVTISQCEQSGFPNWNSLITLIERYNMTKELKNTWAEKLDEAEKERYLKLKQMHPKEITEWDTVIEAINNKQYIDPKGPDGERAVKSFLDVAQLKGIESQTTQNQAINESVKQKRNTWMPLDAEGNKWLGKAFEAHQLKQWNNLHQEIRENLDTDPKGAVGKKIASQWLQTIKMHAAGGPVDLFIGMTLWSDLIRSKNSNNKNEKRSLKAKNTEDWKFFQDSQAVRWIAQALDNQKE